MRAERADGLTEHVARLCPADARQVQANAIIGDIMESLPGSVGRVAMALALC